MKIKADKLKAIAFNPIVVGVVGVISVYIAYEMYLAFIDAHKKRDTVPANYGMTFKSFT